MKKALLYIIAIALIIIVNGFFSWLLSKQTIRTEMQKQLAEEYSEKTKNRNFSSLEHASNEESQRYDISEINKYGGEIIQVGGVGSMMHQIKAYYIDENEFDYFITPPEDWVNVSFNRHADIWNVSCRDGYRMDLCKINNVDGIIMDGWCDAVLKEKIKNKMNILCVKE